MVSTKSLQRDAFMDRFETSIPKTFPLNGLRESFRESCLMYCTKGPTGYTSLCLPLFRCPFCSLCLPLGATPAPGAKPVPQYHAWCIFTKTLQLRLTEEERHSLIERVVKPIARQSTKQCGVVSPGIVQTDIVSKVAFKKGARMSCTTLQTKHKWMSTSHT